MSTEQIKPYMVSRFLTIVVAIAAAGTTFASDDLGFGDDEGPNSEFYSQALNEKLRANNQVAKTLSRKAKALISESHKAHAPKKLALYEDFNNRLRDAILSSRKSAAGKCQRLALKFQKMSARASAVANCRTESEMKIERDLQKFEIEFKRIAD